jgi:hypothetical protein
MYDNMVHAVKVESVKKFFNKTLMDDLTIDNNIITIHKPFGHKIQLEWIKEDDPQSIVEGAPSLDSDAMSEVFWLTKVIGDYNINKFQDKFLFTSSERAMLLRRV